LFTKKFVKKGQFLGIYGGTMIRGFTRGIDPYHMSASPELSIDGDTAASRANTRLIYDETQTKAIAESRNPDDFTAEFGTFDGSLIDGHAFWLRALFALRDLPPETEVREPYLMRPGEVQKRFNARSPKLAQNNGLIA